MTYNPATDFLAVWRNIAGTVTKLEMPGLDYVVAALARAGIITLSVSATAPVVSQPTTAWLQAAAPSYSAEGVLHLWDPIATAYALATPALFFEMLQAGTGQNGVSWWTSTGGPPLNTVGNNGDFAIRLDEPNGVYGPKAAGAWPVTPIPGTADVLTSTALDNTFGAVQGELIYRGALVWQSLPIGASNTLLASSGAAPEWETMSTLLDAVFSFAIGAILYRNPGGWAALPPSAVVGTVLQNNGTGTSPSWAPRSTEFSSGDTLLFHQTAAPTGWTKQTAINDYGLRVTSGAVGTTAGNPFSTVFAQTAVGNTTITIATMPSHDHPMPNTFNSTGVSATPAGPGFSGNYTVSPNTLFRGGDQPHNHSVNLALSYTDVIIASKD